MLVTYELSKTTPGHRAEPVEVWKTRKFIEEHSGRGTFPLEGGESGQYAPELSQRKIQAGDWHELRRVRSTDPIQSSLQTFT